MNFGKRVCPFGFLVILCLIFCGITQADLLVLKNGDRITGDLQRIWDGDVSLEPVYSDELEVELSMVEYIESEEEFEIDLNDGRSLLASFAGADADGNQIVKSGDESVSVRLAELFELGELEDEFEWESNVELGGDINKGNTDTSNTKLRADTTVRFNDHRHIGEITFFREELAGVQTKEQDLFKYSYNWLFKDSWFFSADLTVERDPIINLNSRVILSPGIGLDIWDTPRRTLNVKLGAGYQTEEIHLPLLEIDQMTDSAVVTWALRYRQDFFSDDVELFHNHTVTHNISGRTNTSYKSTTGLGYEITDLLTARISMDFNYVTDPARLSDPPRLAENEDIALLFSLVAEFE